MLDESTPAQDTTLRERPTLRADSVGRALLAPLAGYVVALAGAVALMVLLLLAVAVGTDSFTSGAGVESDDANGLGVVTGLPFQLVALALFGVLHVGQQDFELSLFGLPLVLTAAFTLVVHRVALRTERRHPSTSPGQRLLLAGIGSTAFALVVTLLSWALAIRADGTTLTAASVQLFLGSLLLSFAAASTGRWQASGARWPAWVAPDAVRAGGVWLTHLGVWLAVAIPVLTVVVWVREGFSWVLAAPGWAPTVGVWSYGFGHLGGLTVSGSAFGVSASHTSAPWEVLGGVGFAVAVLLAVTLAGATSLVWHRRRDSRPEWLTSAAWWVLLPVTFFFGAFLVGVLSTLHAGGGIMGFGGAATLRPAFWTSILLGGVGLLIEVASRFLAPIVDPSPADATQRDPVTPEQRRRLLKVAGAAGAVLAVVVLGAVAPSW